MRIVVAPDKFKGSLSARSVAEHLAIGLRSARPDAEVVTAPVADGGEGTLDAALVAGFTLVSTEVSGPLGDRLHSGFALGDGADLGRPGVPTAVIEMALASGLAVLPLESDGRPRLDAGSASSRGTGELILAALEAGVELVLLGVGGSACTDGGAGLLCALGAVLSDEDGVPLPDGGGALGRLATVDLSGLDHRLAGVDFVLASDVENPLLGPDGAASVFGPQKGAGPDQVLALETGLVRWRDGLAAVLGPAATDLALAPGAGAAGGVGYAALAVLEAEPRSGIEVVLGLTGLAGLVPGAELVITGEGSLDRQSLAGKAPIGVARLARAHHVAVLAVCGQNTLTSAELAGAGLRAAYPLTEFEPDLQRCIEQPGPLLEQIGRRIAEEMSSMTVELADVNRTETIKAQIASYLEEHPDAQAQRAARLQQTQPDWWMATSPEGLPHQLVMKGRRVLIDGVFGGYEIGVIGGRIQTVQPLGTGLQGETVITLAEDEVLIPGLVDTHVHINEPGRTDWEGFASATRAAAAGGVTTVIDMPLNSVPSTVNEPALRFKQLVAAPQISVDVGFWGGAVPGNLTDLRDLRDHGVFGFKCFLLHSGVDEFPPLDGEQLETYLRELTDLGAMMIVHAENSASIDRAPRGDGDRYSVFLASRPRGAENLAIAELIERTRWTGARSHVLHLSSADALPMIASAKRDGLDLSVETCPHYLTLSSEEVPVGATAYKCCPPIRESANRDLLWQGLLDGTIDYIASDHSPSTLDLKQLDSGDFGTAWGGIASVQLALPAVWSEARRRGIGLEQVVSWMAGKPAARVGLATKGTIEIGHDADLVVLSPEDTFTVEATELLHKNPLTPYQGKTLHGVVRQTWLRGQLVDGGQPNGRFLRHNA